MLASGGIACSSAEDFYDAGALFEAHSDADYPWVTVEVCPGFSLEVQPSRVHVWQSASNMASWLMENPSFVEGKTVCELGCGTAAPSFVASRFARGVVATDFSAHVLSAVADMVVRNGNANVNPTRLDWLDCLDPDYALPAFAPVDVLLCADVNYMSAHIAPLARTIELLLRADGNVLFGSKRGRVGVDEFLRLLKSDEYGFEVSPTARRSEETRSHPCCTGCVGDRGVGGARPLLLAKVRRNTPQQATRHCGAASPHCDAPVHSERQSPPEIFILHELHPWLDRPLPLPAPDNSAPRVACRDPPAVRCACLSFNCAFRRMRPGVGGLRPHRRRSSCICLLRTAGVFALCACMRACARVRVGFDRARSVAVPARRCGPATLG
jgi:predicted nicotinamide N-methyase